MAAAEAVGLDRAHLLAVQELVVHVEQVFVHESIVGRHLAVELPGLVGFVRFRPERRRKPGCRQGRIARKYEDQAIDLPARVRLDPVREPLAPQVGHVDTVTFGVVGPAMIAALHRAPLHHAVGQWHLTVSAAILEREQLAVLAADHRDRLAGVAARDHGPGLDLFRPGDRVPKIGMAVGATQIGPGGYGLAQFDRQDAYSLGSLARLAGERRRRRGL
jgi:hypothetical protein